MRIKLIFDNKQKSVQQCLPVLIGCQQSEHQFQERVSVAENLLDRWLLLHHLQETLKKLPQVRLLPRLKFGLHL